MTLDNLGQGRNANDLAKRLGIPKSTVYNNPTAFGGVRIGTRWWFFDNLVVETLRNKTEASDASMEEEQAGQESSLRENQKTRGHTGGEKVSNLGRGAKVGAGRKRQAQTLKEIDKHGLLNDS